MLRLIPTPKFLFFLIPTKDTTVASSLAALLILFKADFRFAHSILRKNTNANKGEYRAMPLRIINIMSRQKTAQTQEVI